MISFIFQDYLTEENRIHNLVKILRVLFSINKVGKVNMWIRANYFFSNSKNRVIQLIGRYCYNHILKWYSSNISCDAVIGRNLQIPHPIGIVIGAGSVIGDNCTVFQGVTIGRRNESVSEYPVIGNDVIIYSNSSVLGDINISDGTVIGAHSLVLSSTERNSVYVGIPAQRKS